MTERRLSRRRLFATTALAATLFAHGAAGAQSLPTGGVIGAGTVTRTSGGAGDGLAAATAFTTIGVDTQLTLNVATAAAVVRWDSFNVVGTTLNFTGVAGFNVLNVVTGNATIPGGTPSLSTISGTLNGGGGSVWLINPAGILVGPGGTFTNLSSLVLSTLPLTAIDGAAYTDASFIGAAAGGTDYRFAGAGAALTMGGSITSASGNVVLVAPTGSVGGSATASGDIAMALAADATLRLKPTSIVGITLNAGTPIVATNTVSGSLNGRNVTVAAASATDITMALLGVSGAVQATGVAMTDTGIVLTAGVGGAAAPGVTVGGAPGLSRLTVSGTLTAAKASLAANDRLSLTGTGPGYTLFTGAGPFAGFAVKDVVLSGNGALSSAGDVTLTAGTMAAAGALTLSGAYTSAGAVTLAALAPDAGAANLTVDGSLAADKALTVTGDRGIALGAAAALRGDALGAGAGAAMLTLNAQYGTVAAATTSLLAAGSLTGSVEGRESVVVVDALDVSKTLALGRVEAKALKRTDVATDIAIAGSVTTGQVNTTDSLSLTSTEGDVTVGGARAFAGGITLAATSAAPVHTVTATGTLQSATGFDVKVDATGVATLAGAVTSGRDYLVTGGTGVTLGAAGTTVVQQAQRSIAITATTGDIAVPATGVATLHSNTAAGNTAAEGSITLTATADSVLGGLVGAGRLDLDTRHTVADAREAVVVTGAAGGRIGLGQTDALRLGSATGAAQPLVANGDVVLGKTTVAEALTVTSTTGNVTVGSGSSAPSINATANTALKTAQILSSTATGGSLIATALAGTALVTGGSATLNIDANGGPSATASGNAGGHILAVGDVANASGTAGTYIFAGGGSSGTASGTATSGYIWAIGDTANASGMAGTYIRADGGIYGSASGTATADYIQAVGDTAIASGTAGSYIYAVGVSSGDASGTATSDYITAIGDTAVAAGTAGTYIRADGGASGNASGKAIAQYIRAAGNTATASGDAGTYILAAGQVSASASGTTMRTVNGTDIIATAATGNATVGTNAVGATANGARRDVIGSAPGGTLTFTNAVAGRDIVGTGVTVTGTGATLTAGDDIVIAATGSATVGALQLAAVAGPDNAAAPLDGFGNPVLDPTLAGTPALPVQTGRNIVVLSGLDTTAAGTIVTLGNLRLGAKRDLTLGATGQTVSQSADGRIQLEAGRNVVGLGTLTVRSDSDDTGGEPIVIASGAPVGTRGIDFGPTTRLVTGSNGLTERSGDIFLVTGAGARFGQVDAHALLSGVADDMAPQKYRAQFGDGSLRIAGPFDAGDVRLVQRFDLQVTGSPATLRSVEVAGRVATPLTYNVDAGTRDDLSLRATTLTVTDHAYALAAASAATPGGGDALLSATGGPGVVLTTADVRARRDATLSAPTGDISATTVWAGRDISLTGWAVTASDLRAGDTVGATATAGPAQVAAAETTGSLLDAALAAFSGAATGTTHNIAVSATAGAARRGDATLTRGKTVADAAAGHETGFSNIRVTATGGDAKAGSGAGAQTLANDILASATGTSSFGTVLAQVRNAQARTGNLFAVAASGFGASTVTIGQAQAYLSVGGFADTDSQSNGTANVDGTAIIYDVIAEASTDAGASGTAGRYIFAGAGRDATATGGAGASIIARAGRDALAAGTADLDIAAYAGRNATASGQAQGDLIATADGPTATLAGSAGRDALATALNGTARLYDVTAGRDITAVARTVDAATVLGGTPATLTAGDDIVLVATAGDVSAANLLSGTIASESPSDAAVPVQRIRAFVTAPQLTVSATDAATAVAYLPATTNGAALPDALGAGGTIAALSLPDDRIGQNILVRASDAATVSGAVAAGRDYRVAAGGTVTLGAAAQTIAQVAGSRLLAESRGAGIALPGTLALTSNVGRQQTGTAADLALAAFGSVTGGDVSIAALRKAGATQAQLGSVAVTAGTTGLPGAAVVLDRANAALPVIDGGAVTVKAPGLIDVKRLSAGSTVLLQGTTAAAGTNDVAVIAPVRILIDELDNPGFAPQAVTLSAGGGAELTALGFTAGGRASTVDVLTDTGNATLGQTPVTAASVFGAPVALNDGVVRIGTLTVESQTGTARITTADGGATTAGAGTIFVRGRQTGSSAIGTTLHATGDIVASGPTATVGTATSDTASIKVAGGTSAILGTGRAAIDILVGANGAATLSDGLAGRSVGVTGATATVLTRASGGDDVVVIASGGDADISNAIISATDGGSDAQAGDDTAPFTRTALAAVAAPATGYGSVYPTILTDTAPAALGLGGMPLAKLAGSNVVVLASDEILGAGSTVRAARDALLTAAGGPGVVLTASDVRAGRDATLGAPNGDISATTVWAGRAVDLTGLAVTATDLRAGDTIGATATAGPASVTRAETTGKLLVADLSAFGTVDTGTTHAIAVTATAGAARRGDATLTLGLTVPDAIAGHETAFSTIRVTATGGNAVAGSTAGAKTFANDILATATGTSDFGSVLAQVVNAEARTGNLFAVAASAFGTSTATVRQAKAFLSVGGFADTASQFGGSATVDGTATTRDVIAEASTDADASGTAGRYIFAGAGRDATANGFASGIVARAGRDASAAGTATGSTPGGASGDIAAYGDRNASASGGAARDLIATAGGPTATLSGSAGNDALATALNGTARLYNVTAGRDITAVARSVNAATVPAGTPATFPAGDDIVLMATAGDVSAANLLAGNAVADSPSDATVPVQRIRTFLAGPQLTVSAANAATPLDYLPGSTNGATLPDPLGAGGTIAALSLPDDRIGQNILVRASGAATVSGTVAAGRDYRVAAGGTVTLGATGQTVGQSAGSRLLAESRGAGITLPGALALTSNSGRQQSGTAANLELAAAQSITGSDVRIAALRKAGGTQAGLGSIAIAAGTTGLPGASVLLDRASAPALAVIDGGPVTVKATGTIDVKRVRAGGAVLLQGTPLAMSSDVATIAPVRILIDDSDASAFTPQSVKLSAGNGAELTALGFTTGAGASTVEVLANTGNATLGQAPVTAASVFGAPVALNDSVVRIGALTVESQTGTARITTADGGATTAAAGTIAVRGRQAGSSAMATTLHATGDIVVSAPTATVDSATSDTASIRVAGNTASLTTGRAAIDILVGATGTATLGDGLAGRSVGVTGATATVITRASGGDDVVVIASGGDATVTGATITATGGALDVQATEAATFTRVAFDTAAAPATGYGSRYSTILTDKSVAATDPLSGLALTRLVGSNAVVIATGNVLGAGSAIGAARDLHIEAGRSATLASLSAGRDLVAVAGYLGTGDLVFGSDAVAGDDLVAVALQGDVRAGSVALTAQDGPDSEGGTEAAALLADGTTTVGDASGSGTVTRLAGANVAVAASGKADVLTATAVRDVRVGAKGNATLTAGTAGRDLLVLSRNGAAQATTLTAGDDAAVVAVKGAATLATVTTTGAAADTGGTTLLDLSGTAITLDGDPAAIGRQDAASVTIAAAGNATVTGAVTSAGRFTVDGRTGIALGTGPAAVAQTAQRDIQLTASINPSDADIQLLGTLALTGNSDGTGAGDGIAFRLAQGGIAGADATVTARRSAATDLPGQGLVTAVALKGDGSFVADPAALPGGIRSTGSATTAINLKTVDSASLALTARDGIVIGTGIDNAGVTLQSRDGSVALTTANQVRFDDPANGVPLMTAAEQNAIDVRLLAATGASLGTTTGTGATLVRDVTLATAAGAAQILTQATARDDIVVTSSTGTANATLLIASTAGALDSESGNNSIAFTGAGGTAFADPAPVTGVADYTLANRAGANFIVAGQTGATLNTARTRSGQQDVRVFADAGTALLGSTDNTAASRPAQVLVISKQGAAIATTTTGGSVQGPAGTLVAATSTVRAASDIVVRGGTTATVVGTLDAGRDIVVAAGTAAALNTAVAVRDVNVTGNSVGITAATAGDDVVALSATTLNAGTLVAGIGADSEATLDTTAALVWNSTAGLVDPVFGQPVNALAGNNIRLGAVGDIVVGQANAARDIVVRSRGATDLTTLTAGRDLVAAAGTAARLTTAVAGRDATVTGNSVAITSATAGDDIIAVSSTTLSAGTLVAGSGSDSEGGVDTAAALVWNSASPLLDPVLGQPITGLAGSNIRLAALGDVSVGRSSAARDIAVRSRSIIAFARLAQAPQDATAALATAGRDILLNAPVSVTVPGSVAAVRNYTVQSLDDVAATQSQTGAAGLISLGGYGAGVTQRGGSQITLSGSGYVLDPAMRLTGTGSAATPRLQIDVAGGGSTVTLGDFAGSVTAPTALSDAEFATINARDIEVNADAALPKGSTTPRTVMIGTLTVPQIAAASVASLPTPPTQTFAVRGAGDIVLSGTLAMPSQASGPARILTLGAGASADFDQPVTANGNGGIARSVSVVASPELNGTRTAGGSISAAGSTVRVRANYIALGETPTTGDRAFLSALLPGTGAPPTIEEVRTRFLVNSGSSFYVAAPIYGRPSGAQAASIVEASRLQLAVGQWALVQNTDVRPQPGGGIALTGALDVYPVVTGGQPIIGVFGAIRSTYGVAAAVKITIGELHTINPNNVRINGCVALSTAACILTGTNLATINLADPTRDLLIRRLPSLDLPFELVSGTGNEALWQTDDDDDDDDTIPGVKP